MVNIWFIFSAQGFWLGGYSYNQDGSFAWISNPNVTMTFLNFYPSEPNRPGAELCLEAFTHISFSWVDNVCNDLAQYICEFNWCVANHYWNSVNGLSMCVYFLCFVFDFRLNSFDLLESIESKSSKNTVKITPVQMAVGLLYLGKMDWKYQYLLPSPCNYILHMLCYKFESYIFRHIDKQPVGVFN